MKLRTVYICQNCQQQSTKWVGKCPSCESWNSFIEDVINVGKTDSNKSVIKRSTSEKPRKICLKETPKERALTGINELDQVLGGGFVEGSLILLAGEPGIGKSTLTLQIVNRLAKTKDSVLYVTGEESVDQVTGRARRLGCEQENISLMYETNLENIITTIESEKPDFLVIDSIQVIASPEVTSSSGSLSQVRYCTEMIMNTIKQLKIPTLLIGHVNKDGNIAGPKVLEHLVDAVLMIEGDRNHELRMLQAVKNRFGTVSEVGIFEMTESGLQEMPNPNEHILGNRPENSFGSCLTMSLEGNRPLLMEVQALVSTTPFGYPKRTSSGFDRNRLELLIAVLQKHTKLSLADQDVFINVVGGLKLNDPAADFAICAAITSSMLKKPIPEALCIFGEIGLTGEIRSARHKDAKREKAAKKLGLQTLSSHRNIKSLLSIFE
jgi:DNA repair protein RadA/Sms